MKYIPLLLLAVFCHQAIVQGEDYKSLKLRRAEQSFIKSKAKVQALYEKRIADAQKEYLSELNELSKDYVELLQEEQEDATKDGDLEEALKIKSKSNQFQEAMKKEQAALDQSIKPDAPELLESKLIGTAWKISDGKTIEFQKNRNANIIESDTPFKWAAISSHEVIMKFVDGNYVNLFSFDQKVENMQFINVGYVGKNAVKTGSRISEK